MVMQAAVIETAEEIKMYLTGRFSENVRCRTYGRERMLSFLYACNQPGMAGERGPLLPVIACAGKFP